MSYSDFRNNSSASAKSVSAISEEGFEEDSDEDRKPRSQFFVTNPNAKASVASSMVNVREVGDESLSYSEIHCTGITSVESLPAAPNNFSPLLLNVAKGDTLPRRLGRAIVKNNSFKQKGKTFLNSLEDILQKTAARKAAACLQRETEISLQIENGVTVPTSDSEGDSETECEYEGESSRGVQFAMEWHK